MNDKQEKPFLTRRVYQLEDMLEDARQVVHDPFRRYAGKMTHNELKALTMYAKGAEWQAVAGDLEVTYQGVHYLVTSGLRKLSAAMGRKIEMGDLVRIYHEMIEEALDDRDIER